MIQRQDAAEDRAGADPTEQAVRGIGVKSVEDPFGEPGRPLRGFEPRSHQACRPIGPQIRRHDDTTAARLGVHLLQHIGFEGQNLGLIDFVDRGAGPPRQTKCPAIHAAGEQDDLADAGRRAIEKRLIEESGAHRDLPGHEPEKVTGQTRGVPHRSVRISAVDECARVRVVEQSVRA